ncbi:hypothetical protein GCM10022378_11170 [Salinicoccus jeotgali]|uniref:Uncharacterized protein n=1 Tax=Salinicoccus jeotgali TaxID=381634 RepID=A0ABP7ETI2_9STAP
MEELMQETVKALLEEIKEGRDPQLVEATANLIKAITDYNINA